MRILSINSSGRRKGNTFKILKCIENDFQKYLMNKPNVNRKIEFSQINLHDYAIEHCRGCRICMDVDENKCPIKDEFKIVKGLMDEADVIIFGSPVYVGDINSQMKALLDRLAYFCHRQEYIKKGIVLITTTHATSLKRSINTMGGSIFSWGSYLIDKKGFRVKLTDSVSDLTMKYGKSLNKISKNIFNFLKNAEYKDPSIISLMTFKIQQKYRSNLESDNIDSLYWRKMDWSNQEVDYFIKTDSSKLKLLFAKILFNIVDKLFIHS